jgi:hypothetical protein
MHLDELWKVPDLTNSYFFGTCSYYLEKVPSTEGSHSPESEEPNISGSAAIEIDPAIESATEEVEQTIEVACQASVEVACQASDEILQTIPPNTAQAPPGIPSIFNWELMEDGTF